MRVPKAEADRWGQLARDVGMDRATLLKQALRSGCANALFERACASYRRGEVTLARAAELAGLRLREMQNYNSCASGIFLGRDESIR